MSRQLFVKDTSCQLLSCIFGVSRQHPLNFTGTMGRSTGDTIQATRITSVHITLYWTDKWGEGSKQFANVHELADYLRAQPELAESVGYVPKKK